MTDTNDDDGRLDGLKLEAEQEKIEAVVSSLGTVQDEAVVQLRQDGLQATVTDPAMVLCGELEVDPEYFGEYDVEAQIAPGLRLGPLGDVLGLFGSSSQVTVEVDEEILEVRGGGVENRLRHVELEDEEDLEPDLQVPARVQLSTGRLCRIVDQAGIFADVVDLIAQDDTLEVIADGDHGTGRTQAELEEPIEDRVRTRVTLEYLGRVASQLDDVGDEIVLELGDDQPLAVETRPAGLKLRYIIAPRIEEE